jgi:hypothetical protein
MTVVSYWLVNCVRDRGSHVHCRNVDAMLERRVSIVGEHRVREGTTLLLSYDFEKQVTGKAKAVFGIFLQAAYFRGYSPPLPASPCSTNTGRDRMQHLSLASGLQAR